MTMGIGEPDLGARYPAAMLLAAFFLASIALVAGLVTGGLLSYFDSVLIALVGFLIMASVGVKMSRPVDAGWLPAMVAGGYIAKILFSTVRFGVLMIIYHGSGDAVGYHGSGLANVDLWRNFQIPPGMGTGTGFVDGITGLIYVPYAPSMIGGFFMFATLAFVGQLFLYAAFRQSKRPRRLKWYAAAIFFIPAITYWPASIGKESLMFLGIGMAAYGAARLLNKGGLVPLVYLAGGLAFAGAIRPHISALIIGSLGVALFFAKSRVSLGMSSLQRWAAVVVVGLGSVLVLNVTLQEFNIPTDGDLSAEVTDFGQTIEDNTGKGGSEVTGGMVTSPLQVPAAALKVLFRPLVYEAHNAPAMASALESTVLLLIVIWRSPWIFRNMLRVRKDPYILMCLVLVFGFIIIFSPFLNLGLLARERSQALPFLAAAVIQLGWNTEKEPEDETEAETAHAGLQPVR